MARRRKRVVNKPIAAKFDIAQTTSDNRKHWVSADGLSARASMSPAVRRVIRIRSRYEAENNSWYAGILRTAVNHIVGGPGPRLQVLLPDAAVARRIEQAWVEWSRTVDFADTIRMAVEAYWRDGEVFVMRAESRSRYPVSLDVRLLESDQVSTPWDSLSFGDAFQDDGIRFNRNTDELEIYVYDSHPGSTHYNLNSLSGQWYRAKHDVAHLFRAERPGQVRGLPRATPSLQTLPIMRRQELATLYSAETAANFAMYLKSNSPALDPSSSPADFAEIELTRNMLTTLPAGWEIGQVEPKQPGPLYEMFQRQALMSFCRCTNMPYTLAAGTGKDANFSSFKGDMKNVWEPEVRVEQNRIENTVLEPVLRWFFNAAVFAPGLLAGSPPIDQISHRWHWPPLPELDAMESAQAAELRLASGLTTPSDEHAKRGTDYEAEAQRMAIDYGVPVEMVKRAIFEKRFGTSDAAASPAESVVTTNTTAVADTAMNGAQVTSIVEIIAQVASRVIPAATAKALIRSAFPAIPIANIDEMLAPFAAVEAVTTNPVNQPSGEYTDLSQRSFNNNQKRIQKAMQSLIDGSQTEAMTRVTLQSIGLAEERIQALIDDASDGVVTSPEAAA